MSLKEEFLKNYKIISDNSHETIVEINSHRLRFIKSAHKYFIDNVEVPAVSNIMKYVLPDIYKDIDNKVINVASHRGEVLHFEIEQYEKTGLKGFSEEFNNYLSLKEELGIETIGSEIYVMYFNGNVPLFAGRLDLVYFKDGKIGLCDFKRTRDFYPDRVGLQLNLYKAAFEQSYKMHIDELACMRLRESLKDFIPVKVDMLTTIEAIDKYKTRNNK